MTLAPCPGVRRDKKRYLEAFILLFFAVEAVKNVWEEVRSSFVDE